MDTTGLMIGAGFSLSLGLFFGSVFNTASAAGTAAGFVAIVYILGGLFVVILVSTLVLLAISAWELRRQSAVLAMI
jgi:hypothetical protein